MELLESLRDGFEQLEVLDQSELNSLRGRAQMIIERVFGQGSSYNARITRIRFLPGSVPFARTHGGSASAEEKQRQQRAWLSGQKESVALINTMLEDLELRESEQVQGGEDPAMPKSNRVFVMHGHDEGMRESVARVLTTFGLEPVILHEQPDRGRSIIEKFYDYSDVDFAVVLLSPDDTGYANTGGPDMAQPRARQNVILELGFFLGRLGREKVVALHKENVEILSDFSGVLCQPFISGGDWPYKLTRELRESGGYKVSADAL
jgi:predicted nucleotide-binding protein